MTVNVIYNQDCVGPEGMTKLSDNCVDLVITSPPYPGVQNKWGELFFPKNFKQAHDFLEKVWLETIRVLKPGCKLCINIANTKRRPYLTNVAEIYMRLKNKIEPLGEIIWNKGYGQCGTAWGSFRSPSDPSLADQHEYIIILRKYGKRHKPKKFNKIDLFQFKSWRNSIWKIAPAKASKIGHCAPFPIEIPRRLITLYSFEDEIVLDPFMGSGQTAIACLNQDRHYIGFEINCDYYKDMNIKLNAIKNQLKLSL